MQKLTTYVNCFYWISTKIAGRLIKGSLVETAGRIYANAFTGADGKAKASLNFHMNTIKIHTFGKPEMVKEAPSLATGEDTADDLPF